MERKTIDVLIVEDFQGAPEAFDGFEDELKTKMPERGYDISLTLCKSYNEYKKLEAPSKYDVIMTDIMLPGGKEEIEKLMKETLQDDKKYAKLVELDKKYSKYDFLSSEEKNKAYVNGEEVPFYQALKMSERTLDGAINGVMYDANFASGLLIAQELKFLGKKPTIYTSYISTRGHSMRGRILLRFLGEDFLPFEDVLNVAEQEVTSQSKPDYAQIALPSHGYASIVSVLGGWNIPWEIGGGKRAAYADALEAAIKYQLRSE